MRALILIDIQYDFLPGGALAAPRGDEILPVARELIDKAELVVASQDWHPPDHLSFASQHPGKKPGDVIDLDGLEQILWPDHCVQGSRGAEIHDSLPVERIERVFRKGVDRRIDSYSAFFDNARRRATGLGDYLEEREVEHVTLAGLATDYCVKFSALDARSLGFETAVVQDACRGIELEKGDIDRAWKEMKAAGVQLLNLV